MSKKANSAVIGLFFTIGLALGVSGLVVFSSRSLFHPQSKDILYFTTSLKGLNPGAPVKFRGVTIGSVREILIHHNQASTDFSMPVLITIDKKLAQSKSDALLEIGDKSKLDDLIRRGMRGRLDAESLVTGVLYVALDIISDAPPPVFHQIRPEYHEIPTMPSQVQQLLAELSHLDIRGLSEKMNELLARANTGLAHLNIAEINAGLTNLLGATHSVITNPSLTNSLISLRRVLDDADTLVNRVDNRVDPLADSVTATLSDAQKTFAGLRIAVRNVSELVDPDSAVRPDLRQALEEIGHAGRALAELAEFLERNPNAVLIGKKRPKD